MENSLPLIWKIMFTIYGLLILGIGLGLLAWCWRITKTLRDMQRMQALLFQRLGVVEAKVFELSTANYFLVYDHTQYRLVADVPGWIGGPEGKIEEQRPLICKDLKYIGKKVRVIAWLDDGKEFLYP